MIKAIRLRITALTASFRVPAFVAHQLTLPVPSLSTIYGLISAAVGHWTNPSEVEWLAYTFSYKGKAMDLETIVAVDRPKPHDIPRFTNRSIMQREFLLFPKLNLYLPPNWENCFLRPRYNLLLGRTQDIAYVESVKPINLRIVKQGQVNGVLLPFEIVKRSKITAWLQNLPITFTEEIERRPLGMQIFGVVDNDKPTLLKDDSDWLVEDSEEGTCMPFYTQEWIMNAIK